MCAKVTLKCNASTIDNVHVQQNVDLTYMCFKYYRPAAHLKAAMAHGTTYLVSKAYG
jgi:hypothetical protein